MVRACRKLVESGGRPEFCFGVVVEFAPRRIAQSAFEGVQQDEICAKPACADPFERLRCTQFLKATAVMNTNRPEPLHGCPADVFELNQLVAQKGSGGCCKQAKYEHR